MAFNSKMVVVLIGIILLIGIVKKNGIMLAALSPPAKA
jgi:multidrug efflux pump subunit AcrB